MAEKAILLTREKLLQAMERAAEQYSGIDLEVIAEFSATLENIIFGGDNE